MFRRLFIKDLKKQKVCAKLLPRLLNDDKKQKYMQVHQDIIECLQTEPDLFHRVITDDETRIFWVRPRNQAPEESEKVSDIAEVEESNSVKVMLLKFFDVRGIVPSDFLPQQVYKEILEHMLCSQCEKR